MNEKSIPKNIDNDDYIFNTEDSDYKYLINRLKEINKTISLLKKNS